MDNKKPDFIIVGAMKGGTSTLAYFLENQEDIIMAPGEINYFDNDTNYAKGDAWYIKQFKSNDYNKLWGEKTATYHYDVKVPERIYKYNPNLKLIWILRNPVNRAYSNYWHRVKYGGEYHTFDEAISNEMRGEQADIWGLYLKRSNYNEQIKAFNNYFNLEQMRFVIFEDLIKDIRENLKTIMEFIGLNENNPVIPRIRTKNVTYLPSSPKFLTFSREIFGKTLPFKVIRKLFEKKIPGYPEINQKTRDTLNTYFRDSIEKLEEMINKDLSIWKQEM